jgi:hypothetical protein
MDVLFDLLPVRVAQEGFADDLPQEDSVNGFNLVPIGVVVFFLVEIRICRGLNFLHPPTHDLEIDRESSQHIIKFDRVLVVVRDDLKELVPDVIP